MSLPPHKFMIDFHYREDPGPMRIGPFDTALDAELFIQRYLDKSGTVSRSWSIGPVFTPEGALDG